MTNSKQRMKREGNVMKRTSSLCAVGVMGWMIGCAAVADDAEQTASDTQDLYVKGARIWNQRTFSLSTHWTFSLSSDKPSDISVYSGNPCSSAAS